VVAQAAEGICLVDAGTNQFLEANKAFQNLLGYTLEEILTLKHDDAIAHSCKSIDEQIHYRLSQRHYFDSECQYRCKDGSIVDVEFSANLISYQERDAFCIVVRDISERKRAELALRESERRLAWQANHDPLTELYNRREFETQLATAVNSAQTSGESHILCYLDLDQFKIVNDTCGHIAGDALLCHISTLLASKLRKTDTLARLGGDEFGILLYDCPSTTAVQIAHKLREQIHNYRFVWQDNSFSLGASIGLVEINATTPSPQSALSAADAASYVAKNKGGNRVHLYQLDDKELAAQQGQMQWVTRLGTALEQNRFRLYYQPIIPTSCPHSCLPQYYHSEVLLRLEDESGQIVSPMAFIPAAERYHLMHLIDRWVISTLFEQLAAQPQQSQQGRVFSVNLSGASLNDEQFICFVQAQFAATGIPPQIICFEITETVAITNLGQAAALMRLLKDTGCSFALDDFGSGMSSFAYLKNLPVDYLKIDGAFVREITSDPIAAAMVHSIAQVAKVMGIQTIAEFVEDEQIFTQLRQLQVDFAQGYAISPPLPLTGELDFPTTAIENAKTI
jgi:diguanylate cyclase (GGDEF)-like protein/PAS domain S-box-containing protein